MPFVPYETRVCHSIGESIELNGIMYNVAELLWSNGKTKNYNIRPTNQIVSKLFCYDREHFQPEIEKLFSEAKDMYPKDDDNRRKKMISEGLLILLSEAEIKDRKNIEEKI